MRKIFSLLLVLALSLTSFYGCKEPVEETKEPASLELLKSLVTVEAEGGEVVVGFVINNPDGSTLEGHCADDWCHSFEFPEEGMMSFVVDANRGSSRIANIYIKYGDVEKKFTLSQSGAGEDLDEISTMDFDIRYEINGPEVRMIVKPEFDNVRYYFAYSTQEEIDNIGEDKIQGVIKANVQSFLQGEVNAMVNYSGYTITQALDEYTGFGTRSASMTINARTDYVGWACAISNEVMVISDVVMKSFRTGDVPPSSNIIDINIGSVNCDRVSFDVTTTNEDQYAVYVLPAEQVDAMNDEQIVELFNTSDDVTIYLQFGDYSATQVGLEQDKEYYVLAYGFKWGMATTEIHKEKFRTTKYEGGTPEFQFNLERVANVSISGNVECSSPTFLYYTDYCSADVTAEEILEDVNGAIDWYVNQAGYYPDKISLMRVIGTRGLYNFTYNDDYITPENDYRLYAIAVDEATGEFCTDVIFSDVITTPGVADVSVTTSFEHYFDAVQVAAAYPESGYNASLVNGYAVVPIMVEVGEDVADFYVDVFVEDLSDTSYPTDNQLFISLRDYGQHNINPVFVLCDFYDTYGEPLTISAVAVDKDGNRGVVSRQVVELHYSGCADASEFLQYLPSESAAIPVAKSEVAKGRQITRIESLIKRDISE